MVVAKGYGMSKSKMTKAEFDRIIAEQQAIQKVNPYGSEASRKAYEVIRSAVKEFHGHDIGDYEN
jgi:hypothetical protein